MEICAIVPTRGRPQNAYRLAQAFEDTQAITDLYFAIDNDDPLWADYVRHEDEYGYRCLPVKNNSGGCALALNTTAVRLLDFVNYPLYEHFVFMGDDHLPRTQNWDQTLVEALGQKNGIAYGDDLFQRANLPTAYVMTRSLVFQLQGMTFPGCFHLFFDNFVKQLGLDLNNLQYVESVIIEHIHPAAGKAEMDEGYERVNAPKWYEQDLLTVQKYLRSTEYAALVRQFKCKSL
jgi:hypothetical protein